MPCSNGYNGCFYILFFATSWPGFFIHQYSHSHCLAPRSKEHIRRKVLLDFVFRLFFLIHSKSFATETRMFTECVCCNVIESSKKIKFQFYFVFFTFFSWFCIMLSLGGVCMGVCVPFCQRTLNLRHKKLYGNL